MALVLAACSTAASTTQTTSAPRSTTASTATATAGTTWSLPVTVAHGVALQAVACPTTTFCLALDNNGDAFRYDGSTWSSSGTTGIGATGTGSLSCAGPTFCAAMVQGANQVAFWNGTAFGPPTTLPAQGLEAIGCATPSFCVTIDGLGDAYYFDGSSWSNEANDWGSVAAISCPTTTFCVSVGGGISTWNGQSWTQPQSFGLNAKLTGLTCVSVSFCRAADVIGQVASWNGTTWAASPQVPITGAAPADAPSGASGAAGLSGLSCASSTFCVGIDVAGTAHIWNGAVWSSHAADPRAALNAVSCATNTDCVAVDQQGRSCVLDERHASSPLKHAAVSSRRPDR